MCLDKQSGDWIGKGKQIQQRERQTTIVDFWTDQNCFLFGEQDKLPMTYDK